MANSNTDNRLERMKYLMEFKNTTPKKEKTNIEYHTTGSDGKEYGIIREGNMYYIKTSTPDNALVKESYDYINGYNYRNENGYKSYNEATKHLELKLMALNEARASQVDVTVAKVNKSQEAFKVLTEEARRELDRMHQIFENSQTIGKHNVGDPESKGKATAEQTEKNNAPFEEKADAEDANNVKTDGTVAKATPDATEVKNVEQDLTSDKNKTANVDTKGDLKDTHDDLEGEGVADQHPSGAKAVMVNEDVEGFEKKDDAFWNDYKAAEQEAGLDDELAGFDAQAPTDDITPDDFDTDVHFDETDIPEFDSEEEPEEVDESLDELLQEFMDTNVDANLSTGDIDANVSALEESEEGSEDILKGEPSTLAHNLGGADNSVAGEKTMDRIEEEVEGADADESKIVGPDDVMDGPHGDITPDWERLQESIDRITDAVCAKLASPKKVSLQEKIDRIVAEEVTKLDAWGKHPRYQKPAFQTPANKEVAPNNAKDWNDDSVKGDAPYGRKIGSSAPFDKQVDVLTDAVLKVIKENYGLKKK